MLEHIIKGCIFFYINTICFYSNAQYNLVANPSFENYIACPSLGGQIYLADQWTNPQYPTTPDFMHSCALHNALLVPNNFAGSENARTGDGYAFFTTYFNVPNAAARNEREYIQASLIDSLTSNTTYFIKFYVSAGDSGQYTCNNIGVYFSPTEVHDSCVPIYIATTLPYTPQFENPANNHLSSRNGWTEVSGFYTATGGERFIVIGNFRDSVNSVAVPTGWSTHIHYCWAGYYIDDVLLTPFDSLLSTVPDPIIPEPSEPIKINYESDHITLSIKGDFFSRISVYSIDGKTMYSKQFIDQQNYQKIFTSSFSNGIYIITVFGNHSQMSFKYCKTF